jgi:alpha 1,3-mannosyltransferase
MPPIVPAILNSKFHLTSTAKRIFIITSVLLLLYVTLGSEKSRSWWDSHGGSGIRPKIQHSYADGLDIPLNNSQWGERGSRVRQLAKWADLLIKNPAEDRKSFESALTQQFPFLIGTENSIYTPWSSIDKAFINKVGFVVCAGSNNFHLAAHLIRSLRRIHGSQTPIEIAYAGDDDLRHEHRTFLANLESNISFIDLLERFPAAREDLVGSGWGMKPFALLASSYTRAILIDADALFLTPPDSLFEVHPGLVRTGTLFFHDRAAQSGGDERRFWVKAQIEAAGISPSHYLATESLFYNGASWYEADSGLVALDKSRPSILLGLIFTTWMNTKDVREQVSYQVFYGDKETFWVAMELSSTEYFFQPWYAGSMGTIGKGTDQPPDLDLATSEVEICGTHMLHLDHLGQTPFWINGGVYEHKENPETGYAEMTHYWVGETAEIRLTQPRWYWVNGNTGCLRETGVKVIPENIKRNIDRIEEEAKRVDEMIRNL